MSINSQTRARISHTYIQVSVYMYKFTSGAKGEGRFIVPDRSSGVCSEKWCIIRTWWAELNEDQEKRA